MTYAQKDTSRDDGAPVYFYLVTSLSFATIFRYVRAEKNLVGPGGFTYTKNNIKHTSFNLKSVLDSPETVDVILPIDDPLAQLCCLLKNPKDVFVTIYRKHRNDAEFKLEWAGSMNGAGAAGNLGWIKTGSIIQTKLHGNLNLPQMQRHCNNDFCDPLCGLDLADFTNEVTVAAIQHYYLDISSSGFVIGALTRGQAKNMRTGETHPIVWHTAGDIGAEKIGVGYPFVDIEIGDTFEVSRGCNYLREGNCLDYGNTDHFNGMDITSTGDLFATLNTNSVITTTETTSTEVTEAAAETPEDDFVQLPPGFVSV